MEGNRADVRELKTFFGICVASGILKLPEWEKKYSMFEIADWGQHMSCNRFLAIFCYSMKNIPLPLKNAYLKRLIEKVESVLKRMRWKAFSFDQNSVYSSSSFSNLYPGTLSSSVTTEKHCCVLLAIRIIILSDLQNLTLFVWVMTGVLIS